MEGEGTSGEVLNGKQKALNIELLSLRDSCISRDEIRFKGIGTLSLAFHIHEHLRIFVAIISAGSHLRTCEDEDVG